jgi:simple sugar transport system substrate-binding protein
VNNKLVPLTAFAAVAAATLALTGCGSGVQAAGTASGAAGNSYVNVVKLAGGDWFNRMEVGNQEWAKDNGATVKQTAGDDSSPEKQIAVINSAIPQKPAAITVVPNSPESLEAVLQRARDAGIKVVTHEAAGIKNTDADIEAFDNEEYGAHQMDLLAKCMGGSGQYAHFVGGLTVSSHLAWVKGAAAQASAKYSGVSSIGDPISSDESADNAYQRTKELLAKYPDIKGFLGAASTDVVGIGKAVSEAGKAGNVCVVGTSLPSYTKELLTSKAVTAITFWDPALAGKAMLAIAKKLANNEKVAEGTDLGIEGYNKLKQSKDSSTTFFGSAWVDVTADNADKYSF